MNNKKAIKHLNYVLTELCDTVMNAGFTVMEMYECFDRNGNGIISYSEFCSLLRLIVGSTFDKRAIYTALSVLDKDKSKSISKDELFYFVYRHWRSKLDSLDRMRSMYAKVATANPRSLEAEEMNKWTKERMSIKDAIKKNFPRQMRDNFEANSDAIGGTFNSMVPQEETVIAQFSSPTQGGGDGMGSMANILSASAPMSLGVALGDQFLNIDSQPTSPIRTNSPIKKGTSLTSYNKGEIQRFRIKAPGAASPTRGGLALSLPHNYNVNARNNDLVSGEKTEAVLRNSGGSGFD
jgi:Ca2+-binding EF-hand superfamily protein